MHGFVKSLGWATEMQDDEEKSTGPGSLLKSFLWFYIVIFYFPRFSKDLLKKLRSCCFFEGFLGPSRKVLGCLGVVSFLMYFNVFRWSRACD